LADQCWHSILLSSFLSGIISYILLKVRQCLKGEKADITGSEFRYIFSVTFCFSLIFGFFCYPWIRFILIIGIEELLFLLNYLFSFSKNYLDYTFYFPMHMQDKDPDDTSNLKGRKVEIMQGKDNNKDGVGKDLPAGGKIDGEYHPYDINTARQFSREMGRRVSPSELRFRTNSNGEEQFYVKGNTPYDTSPEPESAPAEPSSKKRSRPEDDYSKGTNKRLKKDRSNVSKDIDMPDY